MGNFMSTPIKKSSKNTDKSSLSKSLSRFVKELQPDEKYHLSMGLIGLSINAFTNMSYPMIVGSIIDYPDTLGFNLYKFPSCDIKLPFMSLNNIIPGLESADPCFSFNRLLVYSLPIYLGGIFASWFRVYHTRTAIYLIQKRYRRELYKKLLSQNLLFFQSKTVNYFVSKLYNDCEEGPKMFVECFTHLLRSCNSTLVGTYKLFSISPSLTTSMLLSIPILGVCVRFFSSHVKKFQLLKKEKLDGLIEKAGEVITGIENVISFSREDHEVDSFVTNLNSCDRVSLKSNSSDGFFMSSVLASLNVSTLLMLYFGSMQIKSGTMTIGKFASYIMYGGFIGLGAAGLSRIYTQLIKGSTSMNSIFETIDLEEPEDKSLTLEEVSSVKGSLEIKEVSFSYPSRQVEVLSNVTLKIEPSEVVGIVGPSGAGKTTLSKLLITLYKPNTGEILLDSTNVNTLSSKWLRESVFSIVPQEPTLFSTTIEENMKYGNTNVTEEQLIQASKDCNIHEFIDSLPMKYKTQVGSRGVMLSTGQRQRICLVRAILKNTPILILDEPTSSLDGFSEELVTTAIKLTNTTKTLIIITHKPQILSKVAKVAVLNNKLEFFGSVEEAKVMSETFKSLFPNL